MAYPSLLRKIDPAANLILGEANACSLFISNRHLLTVAMIAAMTVPSPKSSLLSSLVKSNCMDIG